MLTPVCTLTATKSIKPAKSFMIFLILLFKIEFTKNPGIIIVTTNIVRKLINNEELLGLLSFNEYK